VKEKLTGMPKTFGCSGGDILSALLNDQLNLEEMEKKMEWRWMEGEDVEVGRWAGREKYFYSATKGFGGERKKLLGGRREQLFKRVFPDPQLWPAS
jgi:hypothetical protein